MDFPIGRTLVNALHHLLSRFPQVHHLKLHPFSLDNVSRPERVSVDIVDIVRVEDPRLVTVENGFLSRRIREPIHSPVTAVRDVSFARRANNGYALSQHHLISSVSVQVSAAHEACLGWMSVNPTQNHEIFGIHIVKQL